MIKRNHAHTFFERVRNRLPGVLWALGFLALVVWFMLWAMPAHAQTPTPWPTPIVTGEYVIRQEVTYGDGGVILGLLFCGGLLLLDVFIRLAERVADR